MVCLTAMLEALCDGSIWTEKVVLLPSERDGQLPQGGGLYAVFLHNDPQALYIGQTNEFARRIDRELIRGLLDAGAMPNGEHHTATPGLWYIQRHLPADALLKVAFAPLDVPKGMRKGFESLALAITRRTYGCSPILNYTRMPTSRLRKPPRASSRRLSARGDRVSLRTPLPGRGEDSSFPPQGDLFDCACADVQATTWGGYHWSPWLSPEAFAQLALPSTSQGIYRLRSHCPGDLLYIGHGQLRRSLGESVRRLVDEAEGSKTFSCSFVQTSLHKNQREEARDDLLGAHLLWRQRLPDFQFRTAAVAEHPLSEGSEDA